MDATADINVHALNTAIRAAKGGKELGAQESADKISAKA
jgi:hypothetical protein